jgi:hypothetical protein
VPRSCYPAHAPVGPGTWIGVDVDGIGPSALVRSTNGIDSRGRQSRAARAEAAEQPRLRRRSRARERGDSEHDGRRDPHRLGFSGANGKRAHGNNSVEPLRK